MKKLLITIMTLVSLTGLAKERLGVMAGMTFNTLSFDIENYTSKMTVGYNVGVTLEVMLGSKGFGFDVSALFSNRKIDIALDEPNFGQTFHSEGTKSFLEIPFNFRYKLPLSTVGHIVKPYIFTGPGLHFMLNNKPYVNNYYIRDTGERIEASSIIGPQFSGAWNFDWNVGVGVELFEHAQVAFRYCRDLSKSIHTYNLQGIKDKMSFNTFCIQATWLF